MTHVRIKSRLAKNMWNTAENLPCRCAKKNNDKSAGCEFKELGMR